MDIRFSELYDNAILTVKNGYKGLLPPILPIITITVKTNIPMKI
jgi:hypothetical protein